MELRACNQPWFEMHLQQDGTSSFCSYHYTESFVGKKITDIWNGDFFRKTREEIVKGDPKGTRCEICDFIKFNKVARFHDIPDFITGDRRDNWLQALKHFKNGDTVLESTPIKYLLRFGLACNLRCKMCDHPGRFNEGENSFLDASSLLEDDKYLAQASQIYIIGGEPFLIPPAVDFLKTVTAREDLRDLELAIHTNGFFLNRHLETLEPMNHQLMAVSVDSYGEHYETIRRRATWERLNDNVLSYLKYGREREKNWRVEVAVTVMKSGIAGYPDLMRWMVGNGMEAWFCRVHSFTSEARDENIFVNPELLNEVPGWQKNFEVSIQILKEAGRAREATQLDLLYQDLVEKFTRWEEVSSHSKPHSLRMTNDWNALYRAQEKQLNKTMEFNIYNGSREHALDVNEKTIIFKPSDKRDHIASPFSDVQHNGDNNKERYVRLTVEWPDGSKDNEWLTFEIQDQRFVCLESIGAIDGPNGLEKTLFYRMPESSEKIRITMFSRDQKPRVMPQSVKIDTHYALLKQA